MVTTSWLTISTNPHFSADLFIFTKKTPVSQPFKSPVSTGSFPLLIDLSRFPGLPRFSTGITSHKTISDSETISAAFQSVLLWRIKLFTLLKVPEKTSQYRKHRNIQFGSYLKLSLTILLKFRSRNFQDRLLPN